MQFTVFRLIEVHRFPSCFVNDTSFVLCWRAFGLLEGGEEFSPKVKTVKDQSVWYVPAFTDWPPVGRVFSANPPCSL